MSDKRQSRRVDMRAFPTDNAKVYQAARDISFPGHHEHHHQHDDDNPFQAFLAGVGPGRILIVMGIVVTIAAAGGWASIVVGGFTRGDIAGPQDVLGTTLPSGIPIGVVYFLGIGAGGLLTSIGSAMAKAAVKKRNQWGHVVITVLLIGITVMALNYAVAGSSLSALMPNFGAQAGSEGTETSAVEVVSATAKSGRQGGLTMTVARIENVSGKGRVHLRLANKSDESLTLPASRFQLTDAQGRTYLANPFSRDLSEHIGAGGMQEGVIQLTKRVVPKSGPFRVEFTIVYGLNVHAIAVTNVASA